MSSNPIQTPPSPRLAKSKTPNSLIGRGVRGVLRRNFPLSYKQAQVSSRAPGHARAIAFALFVKSKAGTAIAAVSTVATRKPV